MPASPCVLALEFHAVRKTADFSFLREPNPAGRLMQVDPLDDHLAERVSVDRQSLMLLRRLPAPPTLVLAYCGTAALAAHTAALCDAALVLVDPDVVDPKTVRRDFLQLCATLQVDPAIADAATRTGRSAHLEPEREASWETRWETVLIAARAQVAAQYGGDAEAYEMVDDLFDRYRCWARFLEASLNPAPADPSGEITVICGRPPDLSALLAKPERADIYRVAPGKDTLGLPEVQDLVRAAFRRACG
jgi:hypothetical protein